MSGKNAPVPKLKKCFSERAVKRPLTLTFEGEMECPLCQPPRTQKGIVETTLEGNVRRVVSRGTECGHEWVWIDTLKPQERPPEEDRRS
jgi:hypothetical protein